MDSAMRDMERLRERDDATGQRLGMWIVAAVATAGLVFSIGVLLDRATGPDVAAPNADPLAALDRASGGGVLGGSADDLSRSAAAALTAPNAAEDTVEPQKLTFPDTLGEYDSRPEVEAALAAAQAELEHPDPVIDAPEAALAAAAPTPMPAVAAAPPPAPAPVTAAPNPITPPAPLPASIAAAPRSQPTRMQEARDPLVASAMPRDPEMKAPVGYDGAYTLQVASYQQTSEAQSLAETLRARGHKAFVIRAEIPDRGVYFRVRVGPFETVKEAEDYRDTFESSERMNTYVVRNKP